jgi:hypothetical protein
MSWAAEIKNVSSEQQGDDILISYEISDSNPLQQYEVFVFYVINGGEQSQSLKEVTGDVGGLVTGGGAKSIIWSPVKELGSLHGKVKFKIVANETTLLKTTKGKLDGMTVTASNCVQVGEFITLDLTIENQKESNRFDLYTNYIKAVDNNGLEFYAINYIKGMDKVTTKRPVNIKSGEQQKITVTFEVQGEVSSFFTTLELETKFPSNFMIIKNIPINKQ